MTGPAWALDVVWLGGQGEWESASRWSSGVIPDSTALDVFIDGGLAGNSRVTLSSWRSIDALSIGSGDTFALGAGANLSMGGDLFLAGRLELSNGARMFLSGATGNRLEGGGTLVVRPVGAANSVVFIGMNDKPMTLGATTGLQVEAGGMAIVGQQSGPIPFVNRGTVVVDGGGALLNVNNARADAGGTWEARNQGILVFSGDYKTAELGSGALHNDTGYVLFSGWQDNRGHELFLGGTGVYGFYNSNVRGGTLSWAPGTNVTASKGYLYTDAGAILVDYGGSNVWEDVTLASNLDIVNGALSVRNVFTLNAQMTLRGGWLRAPDASQAVRLDGTGAVVFDQLANVTNTVTGGWGTGSILTIGSGITIRTGSGSGTLSGMFDNEGVISAETPGTSITLTGSQWRNMPSGVMRARSGGTLVLCCDMTTAQLQSGTIRNEGGRVVLGGTLDNRQAELQLNAATGSWTLGAFARINGGELRWTNGATLEVEGGTLADVTVHSNLTVGAQRTLMLEGATRLGTPGAPIQLVHEGRLLALGPGSDVEVHAGGQWIVAPSGGIEVWSGAVVHAHSPMAVAGSVVVQDGGLLELMNAAAFEQSAGTVTVDGVLAGAQVDIAGGQFGGGGVVQGHLFNGARLQPGGGTRILTVDGTFAQGSTGLLQIELAGTGTGEFGSLVVTGAAALDGTVLLIRHQGYAPTVGDAFDVVHLAGSRAGNFRELKTQGFDRGVRFDSRWTDGRLSVTVVAVPEPAQWVLLSIGLIALVGRLVPRRR